MLASALLLDLGNSRFKWGWWQDGSLIPGGVSDYPQTGAEPASMLEVPQGVAPPSRILAASVTTDRRWQALHQALRERFEVEPQVVTSQAQLGGIHNAYPEPQRLGVDRLLAMAGARSLGMQAGCVIDCGTAMTLDGVDADGRHLGGLIVPGTALMRESLVGAAPVFDAYPDLPVMDFATDTATAVVSGSMLAAIGLIDHFARATRNACQGEVELVFAGGGSQALLGLRQWRALGWPSRYLEDLVLHGLAVVAEEAEK